MPAGELRTPLDKHFRHIGQLFTAYRTIQVGIFSADHYHWFHKKPGLLQGSVRVHTGGERNVCSAGMDTQAGRFQIHILNLQADLRVALDETLINLGQQKGIQTVQGGNPQIFRLLAADLHHFLHQGLILHCQPVKILTGFCQQHFPTAFFTVKQLPAQLVFQSF